MLQKKICRIEISMWIILILDVTSTLFSESASDWQSLLESPMHQRYTDPTWISLLDMIFLQFYSIFFFFIFDFFLDRFCLARALTTKSAFFLVFLPAFFRTFFIFLFFLLFLLFLFVITVAFFGCFCFPTASAGFSSWTTELIDNLHFEDSMLQKLEGTMSFSPLL